MILLQTPIIVSLERKLKIMPEGLKDLERKKVWEVNPATPVGAASSFGARRGAKNISWPSRPTVLSRPSDRARLLRLPSSVTETLEIQVESRK